MTLITFQDGKPIMRDGKVGTEQGCCCQPGDIRCNLCAAGCNGGPGTSPLFVYTRNGVTYWYQISDNESHAQNSGLEPCYAEQVGLLCYRARVDEGDTSDDEWQPPASGIINVDDGLFEFAPGTQDPVSIAHGAIVISGQPEGLSEVWIPLNADCTVDQDNVRILDGDGTTWTDDWQIVCDGVCLCTKANGTFTVGLCADCTDGRADDVFSDVNCNLGGLGACCDEDGNCTNETKEACEALGAGYTWTHEALCINGECPNPLP